MMAVYVDELQVWPNAWGPFLEGLCHLAADTLDELHAFASRLGMKHEWFQPGRGRHPHYDLVKSRRDLAVKLGAQEVSGRDLIGVRRRDAQSSQARSHGALCASLPW